MDKLLKRGAKYREIIPGFYHGQDRRCDSAIEEYLHLGRHIGSALRFCGRSPCFQSTVFYSHPKWIPLSSRWHRRKSAPSNSRTAYFNSDIVLSLRTWLPKIYRDQPRQKNLRCDARYICGSLSNYQTKNAVRTRQKIATRTPDRYLSDMSLTSISSVTERKHMEKHPPILGSKRVRF